MAFTPINKSTDYFNTKLWNGNSSTQAITGVGFSPDLVWGKQRTSTENHQLLDVIRGANNILVSNNDTGNTPDTNILNSFDSDGFTLGNQNQLNDTGQTYVGWNWKANGSGSSNTDGSINTTYTSANTTSGFSISTYTGTGSNATVGHGLGVAPSVIIVKRTNTTGDWVMYHEALGNGKNIRMNDTGAEDTSSSVWNATTPTSSVFSVGTFAETNGSSDTFIAYCFADIQGYSKFGSYVGNGNADGPFIYTGFKPAFIILKTSTIAGNDWVLFDNKRLGYNVSNDSLKPNWNGAEQTGLDIELLSNGFKLRGAQNDINGSGGTYIFMAFAAAPLVGSNNIPANAR